MLGHVRHVFLVAEADEVQVCADAAVESPALEVVLSPRCNHCQLARDMSDLTESRIQTWEGYGEEQKPDAMLIT